MVDGVSMEPGRSARNLAEEEPRLEPEPALTLHLLTAERIVWGTGKKLKAAIQIPVQVKH